MTKRTCFKSGPIEESEKSFWKFLKQWKARDRKSFLKNLQTDFQLIEKQVRSIENYIRLIQHQSSQVDSNQIFNRNFDQLRNRFDRSKFWKKQIFEKLSIFMQKLLKAQYFMNKMHEYEIKCFSKKPILNPYLPKIRFSINFSLNLKLQTHFALEWRNFQSWLATTKSHTITCTQFSKE